MFCFKGRVSWYFFHELFSPKPLKIMLESSKIFKKIRRDIRKSRYTTGINNTCGKFATGVSYTSGKFATVINDNGGKLSQRYHWCCWYRWPICRGGRSTNCKSANLWTYKICYICGPSANVAICRFAICVPYIFAICGPKFFCGLKTLPIRKFFTFLLTNTYIKCSNSNFIK